jgi:hippurate hydrolase
MPLISVGQMKAGNAPNVIASEGEMLGTVRTRSDDTQKTLMDALSETAQDIAVAYGVRCEFSVLGNAPTLCNDSALADLSLSHLKRMFAPDCVLRASEIYGGETQKQNGGSEDFANFSHLVPSLLIGICAGDSRGGYTFPLHHPSVRFDEDALYIGAKVYETLATLPISGTEKRTDEV